MPLATIQELARYWGTDYDWRKVQTKLNALPQFVTNIDGLDIHFIHPNSIVASSAPRRRHPSRPASSVVSTYPGGILP